MFAISITLTFLISDIEMKKLAEFHERGFAAVLATVAVLVMEFAGIVFSVATALFRASKKQTWSYVMLAFSLAITAVNFVIINEVYSSVLITLITIHTLNLSRLVVGELLGFILITNGFKIESEKAPTRKSPNGQKTANTVFQKFP